MIAGEDAPVDLLAVVIRVIIAVPGSSDVAGRPVREESGCDFIFLQAAREKILIVVPDPLQVLVSELHSGSRPELTPMALALLLPLSRSRCCQALELFLGVTQRVQLVWWVDIA